MSRTTVARPALLAGLIALLLTAAACGETGEDDAGGTSTTTTTAPDATTGDTTDDTDPADEPSEPADACTLLTAEDASEALGEEAVPGFEQESDICMWSDAAEMRTVQLAFLDESPDEWRAAREDGPFEQVEGVGEEAWFGSVFDDLSFLVDGQIYEVDVELRGEGDGLEVATELAEIVISRL
jgi:hypothetical protein